MTVHNDRWLLVIALVLFLVVAGGMRLHKHDDGDVILVQKPATQTCPPVRVVRFGDGHDGCVVAWGE